MAFFKKRGPQGRQLGVSEGNLMRIYEMTVRGHVKVLAGGQEKSSRW